MVATCVQKTGHLAPIPTLKVFFFSLDYRKVPLKHVDNEGGAKLINLHIDRWGNSDLFFYAY